MFQNLSSSEKKVLLAWICVGILLFTLTLLYSIFYKKEAKVDYTKKTYSVERDAVRYYTVSGALTKYYTYLSAGNETSVLHILDETYKKENKITKNNVKEKIQFPIKQINFQPDIMCSKEIREGVFSYLVRGSEVSSNSLKNKELKYYEVILDGTQFIFSLKEIESKAFEDVCHGKS